VFRPPREANILFAGENASGVPAPTQFLLDCYFAEIIAVRTEKAKR
jgi:hypothetical protein